MFCYNKNLGEFDGEEFIAPIGDIKLFIRNSRNPDNKTRKFKEIFPDEEKVIEYHGVIILNSMRIWKTKKKNGWKFRRGKRKKFTIIWRNKQKIIEENVKKKCITNLC